MQNDDVIWQIINHQFCSFKSKIARERTFCQNPYNVSGLCIRSACPLANSQYATIREEGGNCYLYIKTIERAHTPKNLWEKIKLPSNYTKALELVSGQLEHFPKYLVHRNKQRLTKIHQMLIRMRKLSLKARYNRQLEVDCQGVSAIERAFFRVVPLTFFLFYSFWAHYSTFLRTI